MHVCGGDEAAWQTGKVSTCENPTRYLRTLMLKSLYLKPVIVTCTTILEQDLFYSSYNSAVFSNTEVSHKLG